MLNQVIQFSIRNRFLVVCAAALLLVYGAGVVARMPVDGGFCKSRAEE